MHFQMKNNFIAKLQSILPQHALSRLAGQLANARTPWLKNFLIQQFIRKYQIDMRLALQEDPNMYATFNDFFIRQFKVELRPIDTGEDIIASPADGAIAQIGSIKQGELLQAKGFHFTLQSLFANHPIADCFDEGEYATIYLAPYNYHRVHMPLTGKLTQSIYVPGKLFSVNRATSQAIPNLYGRNERFITIFDTLVGPMAVILVGAMIVGSIQMVWMNEPVRASQAYTETYSQTISLMKGEELGHFHLGSTVILLFPRNTIAWQPKWQAQDFIEYGQALACILKK